MSTENLDDDRPPAGTCCTPCKRLGHWCPAARYIGDTEEGTCIPCVDKRTCAWTESRQRPPRGDEDIFTPTFPPADVIVAPAAAAAQQRCQAGSCKRKPEKGSSYCSIDHYAELVAERKKLKERKGPWPRIGGKLEVDLNRVKEMRNAGSSFREIANALGISLATLHSRMHESPSSAYRSARIIHGKATAKREAPVAVQKEEPKDIQEEATTSVYPLRVHDLAIPRSAHEFSGAAKVHKAAVANPGHPYDVAIADLEAKAASILVAVELLKSMRGL